MSSFDVTPPNEDPVFDETSPFRSAPVAERERDEPGILESPAVREERLRQVWETRGPIRELAPREPEPRGEPAEPVREPGTSDRELGIPERRRVAPYVLATVGAAVLGAVLAVLFLNMLSGPG